MSNVDFFHPLGMDIAKIGEMPGNVYEEALSLTTDRVQKCKDKVCIFHNNIIISCSKLLSAYFFSMNIIIIRLNVILSAQDKLKSFLKKCATLNLMIGNKRSRILWEDPL